MPRPNIQFILSDFDSRIRECLALANGAEYFYEPRGGTLRPILRSKQYLIVEVAFLQFFLAWEDFFEQAFVRYMCGARTDSGYSPHLLLEYPNLNHALRLLHGGRPFVDWVNAGEIISRAKLYFRDGEPFSNTIAPATTKLEEMKVIRNRIAHRSPHAKEKFEDYVRIKYGFFPRGMVPGKLLLDRISGTNETVFEEYTNLTITLAGMIVH